MITPVTRSASPLPSRRRSTSTGSWWKRKTPRRNMSYLSYTTYMSYSSEKENLILPHGGYRSLKSFQNATLVYDLTVEFCKIHMSYKTNMSYRTNDQMIQAARSGRQNIAEGSQASGTSKKTDLQLVSVARASLEELLLDYEDYLRHHNLKLWGKQSAEAQGVRALAYKSDRTNATYEAYLQSPESFANVLLCLIHQANYLLDQQLRSLEQAFLKDGGFTEKLYNVRKASR